MKPKAKERQRQSKGRGKKKPEEEKGSATGQNLNEPVHTDKLAAEKFGVSARTIAKATNVIKHGCPQLSESQRAIVGAKLAKSLEPAAKERQKRKPKDSVVADLPQQNGKSRDQAAKLLNVSGRLISDAAAIIDNQFGRRNLADIDRISLARRREEILRPKAAENLKTPTGGRGLTPAKLPKSKPKVDTRKESAKSAGVGERTYDAGKLILDAAETGEVSQAKTKPQVGVLNLVYVHQIELSNHFLRRTLSRLGGFVVASF